MRKGPIAATYLIVAVVILGFIGSLLYYSLSSLLVHEVETRTENVVMESSRYIEQYLSQLSTVSTLVATDPDVVAMEDDVAINSLIKRVMESDGTLESIVIISEDGRLYSNETDLTMDMSEDMMKQEWYVDAIRQKMPVLTSARMQGFSMDKDLWVISLSREIVDGKGEHQGVVVIDVAYTVIDGLLMDLPLGDEGMAFILNKANDVVFHPEVSYYTEAPKKQALVDIINGSRGYDSGNNRIVYTDAIVGSDWTIVGVSSLDSLQMMRRQLMESLIVASICIILGLLFTVWLIRRLTQDIRAQEELIHKEQMHVLYSQINPHFLYNTLDTIVWMAEFNQSDEVIDVTKALASFFRLSLNGGQEMTTVESEIDHVREYLFIQQKRYQDKLSYTIDVDEDIMEEELPKIILQPLVENSIDHGIKNMDGPGKIEIIGRKHSEGFTLQVRDNGLGFKKEPLREEATDKLGGVGLQNVRERIELFNHQKGNMAIERLEDQWTCITLTLIHKKKNKRS